jgi:hypothetical protein
MSDEVHEVPGVDDETSQRYRVAKAEYQKLLKVDFPDFDPTDSVNQGTRSSSSPSGRREHRNGKIRQSRGIGRVMQSDESWI